MSKHENKSQNKLMTILAPEMLVIPGGSWFHFAASIARMQSLRSQDCKLCLTKTQDLPILIGTLICGWYQFRGLVTLIMAQKLKPRRTADNNWGLSCKEVQFSEA